MKVSRIKQIQERLEMLLLYWVNQGIEIDNLDELKKLGESIATLNRLLRVTLLKAAEHRGRDKTA